MVIKEHRLKELKQTFLDKKCELIDVSDCGRKYTFISTCGHECKVFFNSPRFYRDTILCLKCNLKDTKKNQKNNNYNNIELRGIKQLTEIIKDEFIVKVMNEGCIVDILIKPKNVIDDLWLPVQIKTTEKLNTGKKYTFHQTKGYDNILVMCICISESKYWFFDGSDIERTTISMGYIRSKWDCKRVLVENIMNNISLNYDKYKLVTFDETRKRIPLTKKIEQFFHDKREKIYPGLEIVYPDEDGMVYDCIINGKKVQDKVCYNDKTPDMDRFSININRPKNRQPYRKGDNDYYWFNLRNEYEEYFYLFPESILLEKGYIQIENEKINKKLRLYPLTKKTKLKSLWCNNYLYKYGDVIETIF